MRGAPGHAEVRGRQDSMLLAAACPRMGALWEDGMRLMESCGRTAFQAHCFPPRPKTGLGSRDFHCPGD